MPGDLSLLMTLRVQGISSVERAATALGTDGQSVRERLAALADAGLATERTGRIAGFTLTPTGIQAIDELLGAERSRVDERFAESYERFLQVNPRVLKVCSEWQMRRDGGVELANDHSDAFYDDSVIQRLTELHDRARVCLRKIAERSPRFGPYLDRLDSCVERLRSGDRTAFTAPLAESYHTVWYELHQDLLLTLGLEREG